MATIHTYEIERTFTLRVKYIEDPADPSAGHTAGVEIIGVTHNGQELHLTDAQRDDIALEIFDDVYCT